MNPSVRVGHILSRSFGIWLRNFVPFTVLSTLVYSPLLIYTFVSLQGSMGFGDYETWNNVVGYGGWVCSTLLTGALVFGVFQQLRGRPASMAEAIGVGAKRLFPVLLVGVLVSLCTGVATLALIIPGIIVACMLFVAVPVAVVERPGIIASLKRSRELTSGYKGRIFGVLFVVFGIYLALAIVAQRTIVGDDPSMSDLHAFMWVSLALQIVYGALTAVTNTVAYHDLRVEKEGIGVEELAKVFE